MTGKSTLNEWKEMIALRPQRILAKALMTTPSPDKWKYLEDQVENDK